MQRPRFYDCRISGLAQAVGLCATDTVGLAAYVNEAQERLINDPLAPDEGWWGGWVRMAFNVTQASPNIITPQEVSRIILMDVCKHPTRINNEFYEYLEFGRGFQPSGCCNTARTCQGLAAFERETVVTFTPLLSTPQIIRAYAADPNDVGRAVLVQGEDSNAKTIWYVDSTTGKSGRGEAMYLNTPFVDSANQFSKITGIQKNKTFGEVQFYQVDPTTGAETALVVMQPGEETAQYRKYYVNGLPLNCCGTTPIQVLAMCKLDFVAVEVDSDYLLIASVPALIDECMSIRYGRMDVPGAQDMADKKHASALRILFGQLDNKLGKERTAIQRHIFGSDRLKTQPV